MLLALWLVQVQAMKGYEIRDLRYVDSNTRRAREMETLANAVRSNGVDYKPNRCSIMVTTTI